MYARFNHLKYRVGEKYLSNDERKELRAIKNAQRLGQEIAIENHSKLTTYETDEQKRRRVKYLLHKQKKNPLTREEIIQLHKFISEINYHTTLLYPPLPDDVQSDAEEESDDEEESDAEEESDDEEEPEVRESTRERRERLATDPNYDHHNDPDNVWGMYSSDSE